MDVPASPVESRHPTTASRPRWGVVILVVGLLGVLAVGYYWYQQTRPEALFARAQAELQAGNWERAQQLADRLDACGESDRALLLYGEMWLLQGKPAQALDALNRIVDQGALRVQAVVLSGRCLLELGSLGEAHRAFSYALDQEPENLVALRGLAAVAYDLGQMEDALAQLEQVGRLDPEDGRSYRLRGLIYKDLGQLDNCVTQYTEALRRNLTARTRLEVLQEIAEAYLQLRKYDEALTQLEERRRAGGEENGAILALRAECLYRGGELESAGTLLDEGLQKFPREAALHRLRGQLHLDRREWTAAVARLEEAVQLSPYGYPEHFLLAQGYRSLGKNAEAERAQQRAELLRKDLDAATELSRQAMAQPWDAAVRWKLAEALDRLGRPQLAAMWRKAASICEGAKGSPTRDVRQGSP